MHSMHTPADFLDSINVLARLLITAMAPIVLNLPPVGAVGRAMNRASQTQVDCDATSSDHHSTRTPAIFRRADWMSPRGTDLPAQARAIVDCDTARPSLVDTSLARSPCVLPFRANQAESFTAASVDMRMHIRQDSGACKPAYEYAPVHAARSKSIRMPAPLKLAQRQFAREVFTELLKERTQKELADLLDCDQSRISMGANEGRVGEGVLYRAAKLAGRTEAQIEAAFGVTGKRTKKTARYAGYEQAVEANPTRWSTEVIAAGERRAMNLDGDMPEDWWVDQLDRFEAAFKAASLPINVHSPKVRAVSGSVAARALDDEGPRRRR